jgi:hypothetical protein
MWLFVLCQEHSTDINYQWWLHWHQGDQAGRIFTNWETDNFGIFVQNNIIVSHFWLLFPQKQLSTYHFDKIRFGLHFGRFFKKHLVALTGTPWR